MANPKNEKRLKNKLLVFFGGTLGPLFLRFFYNTNKWNVEGDHHYKDAINNGKSVIIASWHNTLLTVFILISQNIKSQSNLESIIHQKKRIEFEIKYLDRSYWTSSNNDNLIMIQDQETGKK